MNLLRLALLASLVGLFAFAGPTGVSSASAQDSPDQAEPEPEVSSPGDVWDRVVAFNVVGGLDTPYGIGGVGIEITPIRYLAFYAGGGVGRDLWRTTVGVRGQAPVGNGAVGLNFGIGAGPHTWGSLGFQDLGVTDWDWDVALFMHLAFSFEYRWDEGFFGRIYIGTENVLTPASTCTVTHMGSESPCPDAGPDGIPSTSTNPLRAWVGLSFGYALDL